MARETESGSKAIFKLRAWKLAVAGPSVYWFFPVLYALLTSSSAVNPLGLTALFIVMMVSAAWGFLLNDLADRRADAASGRADSIHGHGLSWRAMALLVLLTGGGSWAIVFAIGGDYVFKMLLAVNYLVAILYSVPPVKLKVRRFWGFLANSLMERPLPILVLLSYMNYYRPETALLPVLMELNWSVFKHQAADIKGDIKAGVQTFAVQLGEDLSYRIVRLFLNPVSVVSLLLLVYLSWLYAAGIGLLLVAAFVIILLGVVGAWIAEQMGKVTTYLTPTDPPYIIFLNLSYKFLLLPVMGYGLLILPESNSSLLLLLALTLLYQVYMYAKLASEELGRRASPSRPTASSAGPIIGH